MGLDITAYEQAALVKATGTYTVEDEATYDYKLGYVFLRDWHNDEAPEGWYRTRGQTYHFRAGSYGGYNAWRSWLSKNVLGVEAEEVWAAPEKFGPCVELINFSDCEGVLGPKVCAKLRDDFRALDVSKFTKEQHPWFQKNVAEWCKAFELAAGGGVVDLH